MPGQVYEIVDGESSYDCLTNYGISEGFCFTVLVFLNNIICNIAMYIDDTTVYSKFDWASDLILFSF